MRQSTCQIASVSLIGDRAENQDRLGWFRCGGRYLLAVADGMGGHAAGDRAAQRLVDVAAEHAADAAPDHAGAWLATILEEAHERIRALAEEYPGQAPPATTAVLCTVENATACWAHLGDSRLYHVHAEGVSRTRDHTPLEAMVQRNEVSEADARRHPLRNQVGRSLGAFDPTVAPTVSEPVRLEAGDCLLLCSDGFWEAFDPFDLGAALRAAGPGESALRDALSSLAEQAVAQARPGADNATALALRLV